MVCLGAALSMIVSVYGFGDVVGKAGFNLDPSRIAAQVISGIGFLGAGTILFLRQGTIRGLTTASGLGHLSCYRFGNRWRNVFCRSDSHRFGNHYSLGAPTDREEVS